MILVRDLKPENIMVTADGFAKVLDFGLAKLEPVRQGAAVVAAFRAAVAVFRGIGDRHRAATRDEEEALFVG